MSDRSELLDLTTATKRNALSPEERDEFVARKLVAAGISPTCAATRT